MNREEQRYNQAAPFIAGGPSKERSQQAGVKTVDNGIKDVRGFRADTEELAIEHQRYPRQWMPVRSFRVKISKRPLQALGSYASLDQRIVGYVVGIVIVDERESGRWPVNDGHRGKNHHVANDHLISAAHS